jgi:hypothetical protein
MWWRVTIITLAYLLLGAHYMRHGQMFICAAYVCAPILLMLKHSKLTRLLQVVLAVSAVFVWGVSSYDYVQMRIAMDMPWYRLSIIMSLVTLFTFSASLCCNGVIAKRDSINH